MSELLECPFCGSPVILALPGSYTPYSVFDTGLWYIECTGCPARMAEPSDKVIAAWNRRAEIPGVLLEAEPTNNATVYYDGRAEAIDELRARVEILEAALSAERETMQKIDPEVEIAAAGNYHVWIGGILSKLFKEGGVLLDRVVALERMAAERAVDSGRIAALEARANEREEE